MRRGPWILETSLVVTRAAQLAEADEPDKTQQLRSDPRRTSRWLGRWQFQRSNRSGSRSRVDRSHGESTEGTAGTLPALAVGVLTGLARCGSNSNRPGQEQGIIHGKRCGVTENIGAAARRRQDRSNNIEATRLSGTIGIDLVLTSPDRWTSEAIGILGS